LTCSDDFSSGTDNRIAAEPAAAADLTRTCAYLPLALRIAAAHLINNPGRSVADQVAELRHGNVLTALEVDGDEQTAVRIMFDLSYTALKPDAQRLFRLLGLVPGPDVTIRSAAALGNHTPAEAARLLDRLAAAHLVEQRAHGRYTCHDLLGRYAIERAHEQDGDQERVAALQRLFDDYLLATHAAADVLYPHVLRLPTRVTAPSDHTDALDWLESERVNLVAAVHHAQEHGPRRVAWELADALRGYFNQRRHFPDWFEVAHAAVLAAVDKPQALASAQLSLGDAHHCLGQYPQAAEYYTNALTLCREMQWLLGQAVALSNLGVIDEHLGRVEQATSRYTEALALDRQAGARHSEVVALLNLGGIAERRGLLDDAASYSTRALALTRVIGWRKAEGDALHLLGTNAYLHDHLDQALNYCTQALVIFRDTSAQDAESHTLAHLADIHRRAGRHAEALTHALAALTLANEIGDLQCELAARNAVAAAQHVLGNHHEALEQHQHAVSTANEIGARYDQCQALVGLATVLLTLGQYDQARANAQHAETLASECGYPTLADNARAIRHVLFDTHAHTVRRHPQSES
jgi:tetratricopeptide (TPR) repeat protein